MLKIFVIIILALYSFAVQYSVQLISLVIMVTRVCSM
jgi:hypothetical protein